MDSGQRYVQVKKQLEKGCIEAGRSVQDVKLVAVSKTVGLDEVASALEAGSTDFGENRPDQLMEKADRFPEANWHFIGNIQSRRIRDIVGRATMIHSLFEMRHAKKIDECAAAQGIVQDVLLEVNVSGEESKSGLAPSQVSGMLDECLGLEHVRVCGLMTMAPRADAEAVHATFKDLAELRDQLQATLPPDAAAHFTQLSMGMTEDWPVAVQYGATMIRVGRAIFADHL